MVGEIRDILTVTGKRYSATVSDKHILHFKMMYTDITARTNDIY